MPWNQFRGIFFMISKVSDHHLIKEQAFSVNRIDGNQVNSGKNYNILIIKENELFQRVMFLLSVRIPAPVRKSYDPLEFRS